MKKNHVAALLALLALALIPARVFAQALDLDSGFTQQSLADIPAFTGGFDFDSAGNIYYIGSQDDDTADTQVVEMTQSSGYTFSTVIADYGTSTYGSFVTIQGSNVFYGDSVSGGNINVTTIPVLSPQNPTVIANMPENYDMAFSGTSAYVSANIAGFSSGEAVNGVYYLNVTSGSYQEVLATTDNSGPIAFTSNGSLLYGTSGVSGTGGIYEFTAAQLNNSLTTGTALQLSDGDLVIPPDVNPGNSSIAVVGNDLFDAFSPFTSNSSLTEYNLLTGAVTDIATTTDPGYAFSGMTDYDGNLVVAETDYATFTNFISVTPVPEPRDTWLAAAGLLLVFCLGRNRARLRRLDPRAC